MEERVDCIALKDEAQAVIRQKCAGLSDEEIRIRVSDELECSDAIVARKWRRVKATRAVLAGQC
jgi:hypothetical protein